MIRALAFLSALLIAQPAAAFCKLALALGMDISSSVNALEYRLQIEGLAYALEKEEVIEAILTPEGAHIAATAYEWSGYQQQDVVIDWTILDSPAAIRAFAQRLRNHKRPYAEFPTAIGKALEFGAKRFNTAPPCGRQVIDLSGDGENNVGVDPDFFRAQGLFDGITINGLVILGAFPNPAIYYRTQVMQGPDAFVAIARDFEEYRYVMTGKLLREINTQTIIGAR
ncbi:MAG: DUF1194 domain-containing protein [Pseudomonadota bacterium]